MLFLAIAVWIWSTMELDPTMEALLFVVICIDTMLSITKLGRMKLRLSRYRRRIDDNSFTEKVRERMNAHKFYPLQQKDVSFRKPKDNRSELE